MDHKPVQDRSERARPETVSERIDTIKAKVDPYAQCVWCVDRDNQVYPTLSKHMPKTLMCVAATSLQVRHRNYPANLKINETSTQ